MHPGSHIKQYVYEAESWERMLAFMQQEIVCFKYRLAEVVNDTLDPEELAKAEKLQDEFFSQDFVLSYLEKEIHKQLLGLRADRAEASVEALTANQTELRKSLRKAEMLFAAVRKRFLAYLQECIHTLR